MMHTNSQGVLLPSSPSFQDHPSTSFPSFISDCDPTPVSLHLLDNNPISCSDVHVPSCDVPVFSSDAPIHSPDISSQPPPAPLPLRHSTRPKHAPWYL
jgi:hypothetical protein